MPKRKSEKATPVERQQRVKRTKESEVKGEEQTAKDKMDNLAEEKRQTRLPISLLSGFLGSGKTTLLEHILKSDHGLRIAVIINDMSELNIDATLVQQHTVAESREKLIKLQNGCICCTLRGDLLGELMRLAKDGEVQYVVIESTGISEPEQVAETFTAELARAMIPTEDDTSIDEAERKLLQEIADMGGLNAIAYLDTCVTVIDAFNLLNNFQTADFLSDRWSKVETIEPEDERTISDLLVDQIEFADVILINKIDQVNDEMKERVRAICKTLNPSAKVIETKYSKVDVKEVINTGLYDYAKAKTGMGWLKSLHELTMRDVDGRMRMAPKPETEEYNISSFVYEAKKPFHPKRLFNLLHDKFIVIQNVERYEDDSDDDGSEEEITEEADETEEDTALASKGTTASPETATPSDSENESVKDSDETGDTSPEAGGSEAEGEEDEDSDQDKDEDEDLLKDKNFDRDIPTAEIIKNKAEHPILKNLIRSKGFWWHANRPVQMGSWSQAGSILTVEGSGPWYCNLDDADWPEDAEAVRLIRQDFSGPWGDRRQEIVFIGEKLDKEAITELFNSCLLTDREMRKWERVMKNAEKYHLSPERLERKLEKEFEDGWEDWATTPLMGDEDGHEGHHHH